jgi:sec-independent protein translocase protein TatA
VRRSRHLDDGSIAVDDKFLIVILVLAILFGASRLPSLARNLGEGIREFKKGIADDAQDDTEAATPAPPAGDGSASQGDPGGPPAAGGRGLPSAGDGR